MTGTITGPETARPARVASHLALPGRVIQRFGLIVILAALVAGFAAGMPDTFATSQTVRTLLDTQTVVLVVTLALLLPLTSGQFDLSVSANLVFAAAVITVAINDWHVNAALAVLIGLATGGATGLVNALLVVKAGLNGFIATLATMTVLSAAVLGLTNSAAISVQSNGLIDAATRPLFTLPVDCYYVWILAVVLWYVLDKTPLGRHLRVTGSSRDAARLVGLPVDRLRTFSYVACGVLLGFGAFLLVGTIGSVDPATSSQYLLEPYAAAFLGTAVVSLGRFNVLGSLTAVYIIVVGSTGLQLMGFSYWLGQLFQGVVLVVGLLLARLASRREQVVLGHAG